MNDPIDSQVAAEMPTMTVPSTVSGALVLRLSEEGVATLLVMGHNVTWEAYGVSDDVVSSIAPCLTRKTISKGKRAGQPYWVGRGMATVDPADVGREVTPSDYGVVGIAVAAARARPIARPISAAVRACLA